MFKNTGIDIVHLTLSDKMQGIFRAACHFLHNTVTTHSNTFTILVKLQEYKENITCLSLHIMQPGHGIAIEIEIEGDLILHFVL